MKATFLAFFSALAFSVVGVGCLYLFCLPTSSQAQSLPVARVISPMVPSVKKFSYVGADDRVVIVTSWFEDGVKCTSTTVGDRGTDKNVSISTSCVKL